jgi:hypothetical protein
MRIVLKCYIGKVRTFPAGPGVTKFQTNMMDAPCVDCPTSCFWCFGQFIPFCMGITQCMLRKKVLHDDMSKYQCFQGYYTICCCIKGGSCHEDSCPDLCAFLEGCCCNCVAISASRVYTMEKYNLQSDACDYRLIRINNCLQMLSCVCDILAMFNDGFRQIAQIIDMIANLFYHTISGCMTAQVAYEIDYQLANPKSPAIVEAEVYNPPQHHAGMKNQY